MSAISDKDNLEDFKFLLSLGGDVNKKDKFGRTCLFVCCVRGAEKIA